MVDTDKGESDDDGEEREVVTEFKGSRIIFCLSCCLEFKRLNAGIQMTSRFQCRLLRLRVDLSLDTTGRTKLRQEIARVC